jgi:hypothetical protein
MEYNSDEEYENYLDIIEGVKQSNQDLKDDIADDMNLERGNNIEFDDPAVAREMYGEAALEEVREINKMKIKMHKNTDFKNVLRLIKFKPRVTYNESSLLDSMTEKPFVSRRAAREIKDRHDPKPKLNLNTYDPNYMQKTIEWDARNSDFETEINKQELNKYP